MHSVSLIAYCLKKLEFDFLCEDQTKYSNRAVATLINQSLHFITTALLTQFDFITLLSPPPSDP